MPKKFFYSILFAFLVLNACTSAAPLSDEEDLSLDASPPAEVINPLDDVVETVHNTISDPDFEPLTLPPASPAYAPGVLQAYTSAGFESALADNKTVLVDFHANWCHVCNENKPRIESAFQDLNNGDLVGFTVNFDTESAMKKRFNVRVQSTYLLLKQGQEVKRIIGLKSKDDFKDLLAL